MRCFLVASMTLMLCVMAHADVEYMGTDTDTLGNWMGVYGANGAILFAPQDEVDLKDITSYDEVMIYNRELSAENILQLASQGLAVDPSGKLSVVWGALRQ